MLNNKLLPLDTIRAFFISHNIGLEIERSLSKAEMYDLFIDAKQLGGTVFGAFITIAALNANRDGIQTVFESYEAIEEAYVKFYMGYMQPPSKSPERRAQN